jgi:dipeptidyl aminopeptidase/acylaminoacyl peptidase
MKKRTLALMFCFAWTGLFTAVAQDNLTYQKPPKAIADLVDAPSTPRISLDSKGQRMLLLEVADLPVIAELAEPELRVAGLRINPRTNGPSRVSHYLGIRIRKVSSGEEVAVKNMPANARISNVSWSPDDSKIAFTNTAEADIELWIIDAASATATKLLAGINDAYPGVPYEWLSDSKTLICRTVPENRGKMPEQGKVPQGPVIQQNLGKKAPSRTYQDLLSNPYDEAVFEYFTTSQLVKINTDGKAEKIGKPGIVQTAAPSPDGKALLVKTIHRPYSYLVPSYRFPVSVDVLDLDGKLVKNIADLPLADNIPTGFNAVQTGPRSHAWRADAPATIYWVETQDGGDPKKEVEIRDRVYILDAPFSGQPKELVATKLRYAGISWGNDKLALVNESWWNSRQIITSIINPSVPGTPAVLFDRSYEDAYNDPGNPVMKRNQYGNYVLALTGNNSLYMLGKGASAEGDRPFVDLLNLQTKKTQRLWRSEAPYFEQPITVMDLNKQIVLTSRESKTENPNYFIRDLKRKKLTQLTRFPHPYPQLKQVSKQVLRYKRADGVELTADLYLPAGYKKEQGPLPAFLWAYPEEFKSKANAGQVTGSPYQFVRIYATSPLMFVTQGYAVLDNASMPIVGEGDTEPNDTFIEQLTASAKAAIDEGVRLGVVDRNRVAVGGHSYGAFMTANLLAHSNLFRAGIARSGAYNRTFTPFGFQREERTYWEVPELYNRMSPFMNADKIKTPILLIHGEADNNAGTFPIQSERLYNALKGHGATARFVLLPHESHGYRGKESVMHMLWETHQWLEKYVKNAPSAVGQK